MSGVPEPSMEQQLIPNTRKVEPTSVFSGDGIIDLPIQEGTLNNEHSSISIDDQEEFCEKNQDLRNSEIMIQISNKSDYSNDYGDILA